MKVEVFYLNGRIKVYDVDAFSGSSPWKHDDGENSCSNPDVEKFVPAVSYDFRVDYALDENVKNYPGLFLYVDYYDTELNQDKIVRRTIQFEDNYISQEYIGFNKNFGRALFICGLDELEEISRINVEGTEVIKNISGEIVNVQKINENFSNRITDDSATALFEKVTKLHDVMKNELEGVDENAQNENFVKKIGITPKIFKLAQANSKISEKIEAEKKKQEKK